MRSEAVGKSSAVPRYEEGVECGGLPGWRLLATIGRFHAMNVREPGVADAPGRMKRPPPQLHIEVDHDRCVGNAMCVDFAPGVFELDARRQAEVADPEGDVLEDILVAAGNCPTTAITVSDAVTGDPYEV